MRRRRRWRAPNRPTAAARQVWSALFPEERWPARWRVEWAGFMRGASGLTIYGRRLILLNYGDARRDGDPVETLLHEFVHLRCGPSLRHGAEFLGLENGLRARLGLPARASWKARRGGEPQRREREGMMDEDGR